MIRAFLRDPKSNLGSGLQDLRLGLDNLRVHKLRSLLTMLGMIFGVAAVVAMLSIGAGAQQEVMSFIEQLGVGEAEEGRDSGVARLRLRIGQFRIALNLFDHAEAPLWAAYEPDRSAEAQIAARADAKLLETRSMAKSVELGMTMSGAWRVR